LPPSMYSWTRNVEFRTFFACSSLRSELSRSPPTPMYAVMFLPQTT
jgi:hypothetical protein